MLLFASCLAPKRSAFYMPGEFEPQEAVWLGWEGYEAYYEIGAAMIQNLKPHLKVKIITESDSVLQVCQAYLLKRGIDTTGLQFFVMPDNEFWVRDHGAAFIRNRKGERKAVDFAWANYGYKDWLVALYDGDRKKADSMFLASTGSRRGIIDSLMAVAENIPLVKSWIRIEGGAIEPNGRGTLLLNEALTLQRNPGVSKAALEKEFHRTLGAANIIWLAEGLAEDPHIWQRITGTYIGLGTGGHTDEYVRFADANTILLAWMPEEERDRNPLNRINWERMNRNFEILQKARNEKGRPFRIIKVPLPELITKTVQILPPGRRDTMKNVSISVFRRDEGWRAGDTALRVASASYLNYYVTDRMVLLPSYLGLGTSREKEAEVEKIFATVFPGRKLVFLNVMALNWNGGGMHCGTQQQPR